ncbi:MAG: pentapeptide repeat-containing protein [Alphaproteobacteria bacterium]|nr:pentapeptide repeat-containing protein [Alphaproteobacteria bacterium]
MDWRTVLFGWPPRDKPAPEQAPDEGAVATPSGGNGGEDSVYTHVPAGELRASQQHSWLFDDGVLHWNLHRQEKKFAAKLAGVNFLKEAAKTRLWGRPADIIGDERVVLTGIDLEFADLQGATLTRADLRSARLKGANLRNANLIGALLNEADLTDCDLRSATLDGAQFARANLARANMSGASMKDTNFAWANLTHAVIGAKNLAGANVFGAIREGLAGEVNPRPQTAAE